MNKIPSQIQTKPIICLFYFLLFSFWEIVDSYSIYKSSIFFRLRYLRISRECIFFWQQLLIKFKMLHYHFNFLKLKWKWSTHQLNLLQWPVVNLKRGGMKCVMEHHEGKPMYQSSSKFVDFNLLNLHAFLKLLSVDISIHKRCQDWGTLI